MLTFPLMKVNKRKILYLKTQMKVKPVTDLVCINIYHFGFTQFVHYCASSNVCEKEHCVTNGQELSANVNKKQMGRLLNEPREQVKRRPRKHKTYSVPLQFSVHISKNLGFATAIINALSLSSKSDSR